MYTKQYLFMLLTSSISPLATFRPHPATGYHLPRPRPIYPDLDHPLMFTIELHLDVVEKNQHDVSLNYVYS